MAESRLLVRHIRIDDCRVEGMDIDYRGNSYYATINPSKITIDKSREGVGNYDRIRKKMKWYYEHCCGSRGFGQSINDTCPACESPEGLTKSYKNKKISDFLRRDELIRPVSLPLIIEEICDNIEKGLSGAVKSVESKLLDF